MNIQEQFRIIAKGAHAVVGEDGLMDKLRKSEETQTPLIIKLGLDPSAPDIHLGHAVVLRKIKQMQDLGHQAVIVIGDFTGKIGDPTGKSKGRVALSDEQVKINALTYCEQIFKILDRDKTSVRFNGDWLSKLTFEDVIKLASTVTVAQILERDDFQTRYKNQVPIGVHEFFYPLMQAYDSIELKADIELGGTDQTFNVLIGRSLQKAWNQEQQVALFMPILEGLDGVQKMSKSLNNYIGVNEPAQVMFKKLMEIPDASIIRFFELTTDEHPDTIEAIKTELAQGVNPRDIKLRLAKIVTSLYHSTEEVEEAITFYTEAFTQKGIPTDIPELVIDFSKISDSNINNMNINDSNINDSKIKDSNINLMFLIPDLVSHGFISSKSEFLRLASQGGVKINGEKSNNDVLTQVLISGDVIKIGKKKFVKIMIKD